jgi:phasin family protein
MAAAGVRRRGCRALRARIVAVHNAPTERISALTCRHAELESVAIIAPQHRSVHFRWFFSGGRIMYGIPEQLVAFNKSNIQAFLDYAHLAVESSEKLIQFQYKTSQAAFTETMNGVRALAAAKDAQEFGSTATAMAQPAAENTMAYAKHVQTLLGEVQGEFAKFFDTQVNELNKRVTTLVEQTSKAAPGGSDAAVNAVKSALSAANQAYDAATKAGKQFAEMTEASLQAVASPIAGARKKAA